VVSIPPNTYTRDIGSFFSRAILLSYLRFYYGLKKQGLSRDDFPYKAPLQPWLSYYGLISFSIIILVNGFTVFMR
jgi:amino acid transporter